MDPDLIGSRVGYAFRDSSLLRRALTHRSFGADHNERLEFLGDSILNCLVALELYERFPQLTEGELSRVRANLVNQQALQGIARGIGLGEQLLLGEGEMKSGGASRPSILADAVEALIGAAAVDGGFPAARQVVRALLGPGLAAVNPRVSGKDAKTRLQEFAQGRGLALPVYTLLGTSGQAHAQSFEVQCAIEELGIRTEGRGGSRRAAEQDAAGKAMMLVESR
ncbi:MAG: ribonuclease III [Burkholderiales bacterium]|nr:ribonuclease III [Burkholderiales bacterium]